jgi:hypothetical protein
MTAAGIFFLSIALYQNIVLSLPYFYAFFSLGMFLLLLSLYNRISAERLFAGWRPVDYLLFSLILLALCVFIDKLGMALGYWEYPFYDAGDQPRKYLLEWAVALLYHKVSLLLGIKLFRRFKLGDGASFVMGMLVIVTPVGLLTEALNIQVYSWRILDMPISDVRIGNYFVIFQTVGYWAMALIPYGVYLIFDTSVKERSRVYG